ncbi:BAG family molecular chaperone regulator 8, chloroplastic-like [Lolium rigidum]|uniref:BAG family molecular chaperone regulator 8, chloroplastic-like n=1 Tax=Lolium rigidum TaxID=89674 RepID=UPI001F5DA5A8|nr:BAG family molecular chaperone regulator 8, chloroplastic-like [Lolium rigidum]
MSRYHHHHEPPPPACCSCACVCACSAPAPCGGGGGGYYPVPAPASDQLLHAIAAHLLLNSAPPPPPQPQPQAQPQQPPPPAAHHANLHSSYAYQHHQQQQGPNTHAYPQPPPQHQQQQHQGPQSQAYPQPPPPQQQPYQPDHGQLLLHSLLRRVAALETTLPHSHFPAPPQIPQPHPNPHRRHHRAPADQEEESDDPPSPPPRRARERGGRRPPPSERELAARTIQEHFRRFLARRSRTLRQLKDLAILRSKAASLRGSLSGSGRGRCKDPVAVSEAAMGLLLHLDGIQGGDPMIREGKRAVSRELSRILEFVDKVLVKDHEEMALDNAEYPEGCHGAPVLNHNKKVSFRCNDAQNEQADDSSESSSSAEADERKGTNIKNVANGKPGLAAPAPVHMESRRAAGEMR